MAVDSVEVSSSIGLDGNSYTTSISNDKLTNEDFLTLLLTEMQMQDPTEPMDSDKMLEDQLQMSTIDSNMATVDAMESLQISFAQTTLSSAAGLIGNIVEDGSTEPCDNVVDKYKDLINIRYFFKQNSGPGLSRNYGIEKALGEYVILFDSDCLIPED
jgi:flagellar basal-body rod modification protein FlgD